MRTVLAFRIFQSEKPVVFFFIDAFLFDFHETERSFIARFLEFPLLPVLTEHNVGGFGHQSRHACFDEVGGSRKAHERMRIVEERGMLVKIVR
jgi:hypothetical protein